MVKRCTALSVKQKKRYPIKPRNHSFASQIHFNHAVKALNEEINRLSEAMDIKPTFANWNRAEVPLSQEDIVLRDQIRSRPSFSDKVEVYVQLESITLVCVHGLVLTSQSAMRDLHSNHFVYKFAPVIRHGDPTAYHQRKLKRQLSIEMKNSTVSYPRYEPRKRSGLRNPPMELTRDMNAIMYAGRLAIYRLRKEAIARTSGKSRAVQAVARKIARGSFYHGLIHLITSFTGEPLNFNYEFN